MSKRANLDHLDALEAAATPGPWAVCEDMSCRDTEYGWHIDSPRLSNVMGDWSDSEGDQGRANNDFASALRNAYPALRDELRELRAENERLRLSVVPTRRPQIRLTSESDDDTASHR